MTDQPRRREDEQLTEKEKQRWEEEQRLQANKGYVESETSQTNEQNAGSPTKTYKADGNVNSDRQYKPNDSDLSYYATISEHEEIALLFRAATDKLDKVDDDAKKEKQQIVRDLARDLEKFRPIDRIASEIVEELRKKVSKSVVYAALDEKYKTSYRVQNARKQKKKKQEAESLAPTSELKQVVIDTSGRTTQQQVSEPDSFDVAEGESLRQQQIGVKQDNESVTITENDVGNGSGTSPPQSEQGIKTGIDININSDITASKSAQQEEAQRGNGISSVGQQPVCKHCQAKAAKIMELEEALAVRTDTSIKSAEVLYRSTNGSQRCEFSVPFESLRRHMVYFNWNGPPPDRVWFTGRFNHKTGKVVDVRIGRPTDTDTTG
jgi:hypothetical protein